MDDDTQAREDWSSLHDWEQAVMLRAHSDVWTVLSYGYLTPRGQRCAAYGRSLEEKR